MKVEHVPSFRPHAGRGTLDKFPSVCKAAAERGGPCLGVPLPRSCKPEAEAHPCRGTCPPKHPVGRLVQSFGADFQRPFELESGKNPCHPGKVFPLFGEGFP